MPKIYSNEKRQEIRNQLMLVGLELIKQNGLKRMSIQELTKKVGIAQGTFYNFFSSKEMLVYELADAYQKRTNQQLEKIIQSKGYLERNDLGTLYSRMFLKDEDNVYRFITREDLQNLYTRLPHDCFRRMTDVKAEMELNLLHAREKKENYDLDAVINWIQIMNLTIQNKDILVAAGVAKMILRMIENMLDELFI
ncbi:TetR family transcriptional regulator [Acetobacterium paludosum]|uniref:TetR family transcriptional regulator n=1 Tax=Acetobacterium paludosum TaxID=52693 RepID=A0A923HRP3_9FIRM|nr:TetR/AcrR family transcriptional regulator [Acetobacterium paludosum]MBC3887504.1 TetR family transcriptional regulator [Acetobacterium paludosum]